MMFTPLKFNTVSCLRGAFITIIICTVVVYRLHVMPARMEKSSNNIYLLQWTSSRTEPFAFMGKGIEIFVSKKCPVQNCYVTSEKELLDDITNFDVLLFHIKEINDYKMPLRRGHNQIYVFASMESAGYYPVPPTIYNGYCNLTWTYKLNSDIYFGYFVIKNRAGEVIGPSEDVQWMSHSEMLPINDTIKNKIANKKKAAAWFVSNCGAPSKRDEVVKEIQIAMKEYGMFVDIYGGCGDKKCPRSSMDSCLQLIETDYYFYFAFENSFAEDYVTEKLLHALKHYAVPVVFGGADYERFMPDGSYLDARQQSISELVKQMFEIISDPEIYYKYFRWHNHYSYHYMEESPDTDPYCKLCEYINKMKAENRSKMLDNIEDWWNPHTEYGYTRNIGTLNL